MLHTARICCLATPLSTRYCSAVTEACMWNTGKHADKDTRYCQERLVAAGTHAWQAQGCRETWHKAAKQFKQ